MTLVAGKKKGSHIKKIFPILFGLIIGLTFSEVSLRIIFDQVITGSYWGLHAFLADGNTGYRHAPGFTGRAFRRGSFDCNVEIGKEGLRQKNLKEQMNFPKRVLILGDSFTFGLGVPEQSDFVSLMQPELNRFKAGVINGGQTGFCVEQEVRFGHELIGTMKPVLIALCLFPDNDIEGDYLKDYRNVDVIYGYRTRKDRILPYRMFDLLRTHSYTIMFLETTMNDARARRIRTAFKKLARQQPLKVMQPTFAALDSFNKECHNNRIQFSVVIIPSQTKEGRLFHDSITAHLTEEKIPFLDLQAKDFDATDHFRTDNHWNENGHRKAAGYITPFIAELFRNS